MYVVNVSYVGLDYIHSSFHIKEILFTWSTYNPSFTELEVGFRFLFLGLTFGVILVFGHSLRKYPPKDWSMEQRWLTLLLPLLVLYNNPFFPITFTSSTLFAGILDAIFQSSFLFSLLLFWLCTLHGLRQTKRPLLQFYLPKVLLVLPMWFSALTMTILQVIMIVIMMMSINDDDDLNQETNEIRDPTYSYQLNTAHFKRFQIFFFILLLVYIIYIAFLIVKAFTELR